jgi:hypothetical protein
MSGGVDRTNVRRWATQDCVMATGPGLNSRCSLRCTPTAHRGDGTETGAGGETSEGRSSKARSQLPVQTLKTTTNSITNTTVLSSETVGGRSTPGGRKVASVKVVTRRMQQTAPGCPVPGLAGATLHRIA